MQIIAIMETVRASKSQYMERRPLERAIFWRKTPKGAEPGIKDIDQKKLASILGINEATLWRKIKNDGAFTRDEMSKIIEALDITDPEAIFLQINLRKCQILQGCKIWNTQKK